MLSCKLKQRQSVSNKQIRCLSLHEDRREMSPLADVVFRCCSALFDAVRHCFAKKLQMLLIDIEPVCQTTSVSIKQRHARAENASLDLKTKHFHILVRRCLTLH